MKIKPINLNDYINQLEPLILWHAQEVYHDNISPDLSRYAELAEMGLLVLLGVFTADSQLVGYASVFLNTHLHKRHTVAVIDAIFIKKEYRIGRNGLLLIEACEVTAKNKGAKEVLVTAKHGSSFAKILARRYESSEICYAREL